MKTYQFCNPVPPETDISVVRTGQSFITLRTGSTGLSNFLSDWQAGATVLNADGSPAPYSDQAVRDLKLTPPGS